MHAWYALETQRNGRIVTRGARGGEGRGRGRGRALESEGRASAATEVGCNGLERERGVPPGGTGEREGNDRLDSNQHFTACKTAPFRNIASSVAAPLNSA